jgi:hypothetical protein
VALNEARANVGIALSNLMHSLPTPEKIAKANSAMDGWIKELEAAKPWVARFINRGDFFGFGWRRQASRRSVLRIESSV